MKVYNKYTEEQYFFLVIEKKLPSLHFTKNLLEWNYNKSWQLIKILLTKNCTMILMQRLNQCSNQVKLINTNILQAKKYYLRIKNKQYKKLILIFRHF